MEKEWLMDDPNNQNELVLQMTDTQPPRTTKRFITYWLVSLILASDENRLGVESFGNPGEFIN